MHFTWTWNYTLFAVVLLLSLFLLLGILLLLRSRHGKREYPRLSRYMATPQSVSTPYGYYWSEETQKLVAPGVARARTREYHLKGKY